MKTYTYHRPTTVDEACALLAGDPGARIMAGGTDLLVRMRRAPLDLPPTVVSLRAIRELCVIEERANRLRIGAMVPLTDVGRDPRVAARCPALVASFRTFGSRQIRNVATLGGNLGNASPAADSAPPLLAHAAILELRSSAGTREVPIEEFFTGPGATVLRSGELVSAVLLDAPPAGFHSAFRRQGRVSMDLALVCVAVYLERDGDRCARARLAAGAVAPTPRRLPVAERILEGSALDTETIERALDAVDAAVAPIDDLRAAAWYRKHLTRVLLRRALAGAVEPTAVGEGTR